MQTISTQIQLTITNKHLLKNNILASIYIFPFEDFPKFRKKVLVTSFVQETGAYKSMDKPMRLSFASEFGAKVPSVREALSKLACPPLLRFAGPSLDSSYAETP